MLQMVKTIFGFEGDQELVELYNSEFRRGRSFEAHVLVLLMRRMGLSRKYSMEMNLTKAEAEKTAQFYVLDLELDKAFFNRKPPSPKDQEKDPKNIRMKNALDFLSKNIKKEASLTASDFPASWLETFNLIFPRYFGKNRSKIER